MKKFFTLIAAVAMAASVNAQSEWNFSNWTAKEYSETYEQDGLTLVVGSSTDASGATKLCPITIDANNKTIDNVKYTQRLKFGGKGDFAEDGITPKYRVLQFNVSGPADIYVVGTTSNKNDPKELYVKALATGATELADVATISYAANEQKGETVSYTGGAGVIYVYPNGGLNLYDIKVTPKGSTGISSVNAAEAKAEGATFNLLGQKVAANAKGLVVKNGKKFINK